MKTSVFPDSLEQHLGDRYRRWENQQALARPMVVRQASCSTAIVKDHGQLIASEALTGLLIVDPVLHLVRSTANIRAVKHQVVAPEPNPRRPDCAPIGVAFSLVGSRPDPGKQPASRTRHMDRQQGSE
jgi:hypothetical protein